MNNDPQIFLNLDQLPIIEAAKCVSCKRPFIDIRGQYACNKHKISGFCLPCMFRDHVFCDIFNVHDEVSHYTKLVNGWFTMVIFPKLDAMTSKRCALRQAISETQSLMGPFGSQVANCIETNYLDEARRAAQLFDEIEHALKESIYEIEALFKDLFGESKNHFDIVRYHEFKDSVKRMTNLFRKLDGVAKSNDMDNIIKLRVLMRTISTTSCDLIDHRSGIDESIKETPISRGRHKSTRDSDSQVSKPNISMLRHRSKSVCDNGNE